MKERQSRPMCAGGNSGAQNRGTSVLTEIEQHQSSLKSADGN